MKRLIFTIISVILVITVSIIPTFAEEAVILSYVDTIYHTSGGYIWTDGSLTQNFGGTSTTAVFPANCSAYAWIYDGFDAGYTYTVDISYRFNSGVIPSQSEALEKLKARVWLIYNDYADFSHIDASLPNRGIYSTTDETSPFYGDVVATTYFWFPSTTASTMNRDLSCEYVFQVKNKTAVAQNYLCFGIDGLTSLNNVQTDVQITKYKVTATRQIDEGAFYQANIDALNNIQESIDNNSQAQITAITNNGTQITNSVNELKEQNQTNAETAHEDAEKTQEAIENMPSNEHQYVQDNMDDSEIGLPDIDTSGAESFANNLISIVSTNEEASSLHFPKLQLPAFCGGGVVFDGADIDFNQVKQNPNINAVLLACKGIFSVASIYAIIKIAINLVGVALGTEKEDKT